MKLNFKSLISNSLIYFVHFTWHWTKSEYKHRFSLFSFSLSWLYLQILYTRGHVLNATIVILYGERWPFSLMSLCTVHTQMTKSRWTKLQKEGTQVKKKKKRICNEKDNGKKDKSRRPRKSEEAIRSKISVRIWESEKIRFSSFIFWILLLLSRTCQQITLFSSTHASSIFSYILLRNLFFFFFFSTILTIPFTSSKRKKDYALFRSIVFLSVFLFLPYFFNLADRRI